MRTVEQAWEQEWYQQIDDDQLTKGEKFLKSVRDTTAVTAGAIAVMLAAVSAARGQGEIAVMTREPTAIEADLLSAAKGSIVPEEADIWLDCMPDSEMDALVDVPGETLDGYVLKDRMTDTAWPVLHVRESICQNALGYAQNPDKTTPTLEQVLALDTIVHEAAHVDMDESDEAATACYAFQNVDDYARALGATLAESQALQSMNQTVYLQMRPDEYRTPDCYDGGPLDLAPYASETFPYGTA